MAVPWQARYKFCWWSIFYNMCYGIGPLRLQFLHWPFPLQTLGLCVFSFSVSLVWTRSSDWCLLVCWQPIGGMPVKCHRSPNVHYMDDAIWRRWMVFLWTTDEKCSRVGTDQSSSAFEALVWISWDKNHIQEVASFIWVHGQVIFYLHLINTYLTLRCLHVESSQKCNQDDFHHHHGNVFPCTATGSKTKWLKIPIRNLWKWSDN